MIDATDAVLQRLAVLEQHSQPDDATAADATVPETEQIQRSPEEEALLAFVKTSEQLAAEIAEAQRALAAPHHHSSSAFGAAAASARTPPAHAAAETRLRACCDSVKAFRDLVDAAEQRTKQKGEEGAAGTLAHLRAACRAMFALVEELAELVQKRKQAALERERARARRYHMLPEQRPAASDVVRRRTPHQGQAAAAGAEGVACGDLSTATREAENAMLVEQIEAQETCALSQIEAQIAEIAEMQAAIAAKVLEQAEDIDVLREQAGRSLANIDEANRQLRRATAPPKKRRACLPCCCCFGRCSGLLCGDCHSATCAFLVLLGTLLLVSNFLSS